MGIGGVPQVGTKSTSPMSIHANLQRGFNASDKIPADFSDSILFAFIPGGESIVF